MNKFTSVSGGTKGFFKKKNIKQQTNIFNEQISSRRKHHQTTQMQLNIPRVTIRFQDPVAG